MSSFCTGEDGNERGGDQRRSSFVSAQNEETKELTIEVEEVGIKRRSDGLIIGVVIGLEVRVAESLLDGETLLGVD